MGMDCYAYSIIGIKISDEDLPRAQVSVRKRAFNHKFVDDGETEFHPKTGKPLWLDETEMVEEDYAKYALDENMMDEGQELIDVKDMDLELYTDGYDDDVDYYIGIVSGTGSHRMSGEPVFTKLDDSTISDTRKRCEAFIEKYGLKASAFGLYTVLDISV